MPDSPSTAYRYDGPFSGVVQDVFHIARSDRDEQQSVLIVTRCGGDVGIGTKVEIDGRVLVVGGVDGRRERACLTGQPLADGYEVGLLFDAVVGRSAVGREITSS